MPKASKLTKVNVYANKHIKGTTYPPIYGLHMGLMMTEKDIKICLENGAKVYEVLPGNKTRQIRLNESDDKKGKKYSFEDVNLEELEELTRPDNAADKFATISTESSFIEKENKFAESSETI